MRKLILASGSPRRKELLEKAGLAFEIQVSHEEEHYTKTAPCEIVMELAALKAESIADLQTEDAVILGADTVVVSEGHILGKPSDEAEAKEMIRCLQGKTHQVMTGVCLIKISGKDRIIRHFYESTDVHVVSMPEEEIEKYIAVGESMDAAGAYKIQGAFGRYIDRFDGDMENIIGLPVKKVLKELEDFR